MSACVFGALPWMTAGAGAAGAGIVSGSVTDTNSCTSTVSPAIAPPSSVSVPVTASADASPDPHEGNAITLSNAKLTTAVPADLVQTGYDAGVIADGATFPTNVSFVLGGSNTTEGTRTVTASFTQTVHVVGGVVQPLTTTVALPDTTWTPADAAAPVSVSEQSMSLVVSIDIAALGTAVTDTFDCTPTTAATIVAIDPGATTTTVATTTTTPAPCTNALCVVLRRLVAFKILLFLLSHAPH